MEIMGFQKKWQLQIACFVWQIASRKDNQFTKI